MKFIKQLIALAMLIFVVGLALMYWPKQNTLDSEVQGTPADVPQGWTAFQNANLVVAYPSGFTAAEALEPYHFLPNIILSLYTNAASYKQMNYSQDGRVVVSSAELESEACYTPPEAAQNKTFDGIISLNGATWRAISLSDAATGHRYETDVYRILHKGMCYEIVSTLHFASDWTDIDMDAAEASQKEMRELLSDVVQTVRLK